MCLFVYCALLERNKRRFWEPSLQRSVIIAAAAKHVPRTPRALLNRGVARREISDGRSASSWHGGGWFTVQRAAVGGSGGPVDDVDTRVCVDDAGHLTDRKRKRRVLEGLLHGAATECAEVAAAPAQSGHSNMSVTEFQGEGQGRKRGGLKIKSPIYCVLPLRGERRRQPFSNVNEWFYPDT